MYTDDPYFEDLAQDETEEENWTGVILAILFFVCALVAVFTIFVF